MDHTLKIEDRKLIDKCLRGNQLAQYQLYDRYHRAMYSTIIRMTPRVPEAEDILQETFVKVFEKLNTFRGQSTLGAWIKRIAVNATLNYIRSKKKVNYSDLGDFERVIPEEEDSSSPALPMEVIHEAIKKLPQGCRVVFSLFLIEGYQHKEIAQILSISESTSKSQYQRARVLLQKQLKSKLCYD